MGTRRKGRILAFQVLYSYEFYNERTNTGNGTGNKVGNNSGSNSTLTVPAKSGGGGTASPGPAPAADRVFGDKGLPGKSLEELLDFSWLDETKKDATAFYMEAIAFARLIVIGTLQNLEKIDNIIKNQLENWDFKRLSKVDLAILRMSVYCLCYQQDIPQTVTIDEAVDIAKEYSTDDSYRFINGVLDGIVKATKS